MTAIRTLFASALLAGLPALAAAQGSVMDNAFRPGEWAVLPEYCVDTQAGPFGGPDGSSGLNRSPRAGNWVGLMGTDFWHMHHYCYALRDLHRINQAAPREQRMLYGRAQSDLGYVIKNAQPTMPLMPEVFLRYGDISLQLGDLPGAQSAFEQSRKIKPDYWPAYTHWIDVLIGLKQTAAAQALTEEGLAAVPGNTELLQRKKLLQNKPAAPAKKAKSGAASAAPR